MSQTASDNISLDSPELTGAMDSNGRSSSRIELSEIYQPIASELAIVERMLQSELKTNTPWVDQLLQDNWIGGGKRIRPVFLLLSGAVCGELGTAHHRMAAAVEMVHCATLVHDDVLDGAETRRHLPTVNANWDNRASVLLGDYLFTHAFFLASQSDSSAALKILSRSANKVCEGEIRQNAWQGKYDLSEQDYLQMIADKTAELCSSSCRIGACLSGADDETGAGFEAYGRSLGVAFQIIDDVLDLIGSPDQVGKTLGTDLVNQKPTLPVIHSLKNSGPERRSQLIELLQSDPSNQKSVLELLDLSGSIEYARTVARRHANSAMVFAETLESSSHASSMIQMADFVCQRTF